MNRTATIETVVRPIRKLFIIDPDDLRSFMQFVASSSRDMNGIRNLILLNDDHLFDENTVAFVKRHDPDLILNHSSLHDDLLYGCYRTRVKNNTDAGFTVHSTCQLPFWYFQNIPPLVVAMSKLSGKEISLVDDVWAATVDSEGNPTPEQVLFSLNCGVADETLPEKLRISIFRQVKLKTVTTPEQFSSAALAPESSLLNLPAQFSFGGTSSSIWDVEYNSEGWFIEKPTLILGTSGQLQSMVYFWNMRATYPKNKTLWMPIELAERYLGLLGNYEHFGSFVGTVPDQTSVANALQKMTEIDCSKYYFPVLQYWNTFAHVQNVPVVDERINVSHPSEKIFFLLSKLVHRCSRKQPG